MKEINSRGWVGCGWISALFFLVTLFLGRLPCVVGTQCGLVESNVERTTVENRSSECAVGVEWNFKGGDALITGDMDVYFLVDESGSVGSANFQTTKEFINTTLARLYERGAIQEHNHVGFGQFSWNTSFFFKDFVSTGGQKNDKSVCDVTFKNFKDCVKAGTAVPSKNNAGEVITKEECVGNSWTSCYGEAGFYQNGVQYVRYIPGNAKTGNYFPYERNSTWFGGINRGAAFDNVPDLVEYIAASQYLKDRENVLDTAVFTAIGDGMVGMFQDIILPEITRTEEPPSRVAFFVVTDGWQNQGKYTVFEAFDEIHAQLASNGNFDPGFLDFFPVGVNNALVDQLEEIDGPNITGRYFMVDNFDELDSIVDDLVDVSVNRCAHNVSIAFDVPATIVPDSIRSYGITIDVQPSETGDEETQQHCTFSILIPSFDTTTHSLSYELDLCGCNGVPVPLTYTSFSDFDINGVLADGKTFPDILTSQEISVLPSKDCFSLSIEVDYDSDSWGGESIIDRRIVTSDGSAMGRDYIIFKVQLTNTGNYSLTFPELYITDELDEDFQSTCVEPLAGTEIYPGDSVTCDAKVYITEEMVEDELVTNIACAGVQFDTSSTLNLEKIYNSEEHAVPKFFHFIASQHFEYGSSNGIGTEEDPFDIEIGNDIVWTWIIKNDGEQIATIVDWECDLFSCSSMLNLSPEYCPGFTSNTMALGNNVTCSYPMAVKQDYIEAGMISNSVTLTAVNSDLTVSAKQTATNNIWLLQNPVLKLEISAFAIPSQYTAYASIGRVFTETPLADNDAFLTVIAVTNFGNMRLYNIEVQEASNLGNPCLGQLNYQGDGNYLAPQESFYCLKGSSNNDMAVVKLSQDNVDDPAGVTKAATAQAWDSTGQPATCSDSTNSNLCSSSDTSVWPVGGTLFVSIQSSHDENQVSMEGNRIQFVYKVQNKGRTTLRSVYVYENLTGLEGNGTFYQNRQDLFSIAANTDAPGGSCLCIASYTLAQDNIEYGSITFNVDANAKAGSSDTNVTTSGSLNLNLLQRPIIYASMSFEHEFASSGDPEVGEMISFTVMLENRGNILLVLTDDIEVTFTSGGIDTVLESASVGCVDDDGQSYFSDGDDSNLIMPVQKSVKCNYERILTRSDIDNEIWASSVIVKAASFSSGESACIENNSAARCTHSATGSWVNDYSIVLTKEELYTGNNEPAVVGQEIYYKILILNSGEGSINEIRLTDSLLAAKGIEFNCESYNSIAPEDSLQCISSSPYTVQQTDIDNGGVFSEVFVTANELVSGETVPGKSIETQVILNPNPGIEVDIRIDPDENDLALAWVNGAELETKVFLKNIGNVNLKDVTVTTTVYGEYLGAIVRELPVAGGSWVKVSDWTFEMDQLFIDNLSYSNTVTIQATHVHLPSLMEINACSDNVESKCTDTEQRQWSRPGLIEIEKSYSAASFNVDDPQMAGSRIVYEYTVSNTGDMMVTSLVVVDDTLDSQPSCNSITLAPNESTYCWGNYLVSQVDIEAGYINSTASAYAVLLKDDSIETPVAQSSLNLKLVQDPKLTIEKAATLNIDSGTGDDSTVDIGDTISFNVKLTNAGNVQLSRVANGDVIEGNINAAIQPCGGALFDAADGSAMLVGDTVTCSYIYTITQADIDAGSWINTAKITLADSVAGHICTGSNECSVTKTGGWVVEVAGYITKSHGSITPQPNVLLGPTSGSTIPISYLLQNTGVTTITSINVKDVTVYSGPICSVALLLPGENTMCNLEYVITQDDIEAGFKDGVAEFWGKSEHYTGETLKLDEDADSSILLDQTPVLHIERTLVTSYDSSGDTSQRTVGDVLNFIATIHNKGNVNLYNVVLTETLSGATMSNGCVRDPLNFLAPGDSFVCTYTYELTQGDVDAEQWGSTLSGTAESLSGSSACNTVVSPGHVCSDTKEDAWINDMNITLTTAHDYPLEYTFPDTTHQVVYFFTVENIGYGTITDLVINCEMMVNASVSIECDNTVIVPGSKVVCSLGPYSITERNIEEGSIESEAMAVSKKIGSVSDIVASAPDFHSVPLEALPSISLSLTNTYESTSPASAGSAFVWKFNVTNDGLTVLEALAWTSNTVDVQESSSDILCAQDTIQPGESIVCTAIEIIDQAQINAGSIVHNVIVTASARTSKDVMSISAPDSNTVDLLQLPLVSIVKTASAVTSSVVSTPSTHTIFSETPVAGNDHIVWSITVTNLGNVDLFNIYVTDDMPGVNFCPGSTSYQGGKENALGPLESFTCSLDGNGVQQTSLSQTLIDSISTEAALGNHGMVSNTATVSAEDIEGTAVPCKDSSCSSTATCSWPLSGEIAIIISDNYLNTVLYEGDKIELTYRVSNEGRTNLNTVSIDTSPGLSAEAITVDDISCSIPGSTLYTPGGRGFCYSTYTVTQEDMEKGSIVAEAKVISTVATTNIDATAEKIHTIEVTQEPLLYITKTYQYMFTDTDAPFTPLEGESIRFTLVLANMGNVLLDISSVVDTYTTGGVTSSIEITGCKNEEGTEVNYLTYNIPVGKSVTCIYHRILSHNDINSETWTSEATASAISYASKTNACGVGSSGSSRCVHTISGGWMNYFAISAVRTAAYKTRDGEAVNSNEPAAIGQTIDYKYVITNEGSASIQDIVLEDTILFNRGLEIICDSHTEAHPGESMSCWSYGGTTNGMYIIDQEDIEAGVVSTTSKISANEIQINDEPLTPIDPITVSADVFLHADPKVLISMVVTPSNTLSLFIAGEELSMSILLQNTGNVKLTNLEMTTSDYSEELAMLWTELDAGELAAVTVSTYSKSMSQKFIDVLAWSNTATVKVEYVYPPTGDATNVCLLSGSRCEDTVTRAWSRPGQLSVSKDHDRQTFQNDIVQYPGAIITWIITLENIGDLTLTSIVINDSMLKDNFPTCETNVLSPGDGTRCTAPMILTQEMIDAGSITNTVEVYASIIGDLNIKTATVGDTHVIPLVRAPSFTFSKTGVLNATDPSTVRSGDFINFVINIENTGNVELKDLIINDVFTGSTSISGPDQPCGGNISLIGVQETVTCNYDYELGQGDIDEAAWSNIAKVTSVNSSGGILCNGLEVPDYCQAQVSGSWDILILAQLTTTYLTTPSTPPYLMAGDEVQYTYTIRNVGLGTISSVYILDDLLPIGRADCPNSVTLYPYATPVTCSGVYTLSQDNIDSGEVSSSATLFGTPVNFPGDMNELDIEHSVVKIERHPEISIVTSGTLSVPNGHPYEGDDVTWSFNVKNIGNVVFKLFTVSDSMGNEVTCNTTATALLFPGDGALCSSVSQVTQDAIESGEISNLGFVTAMPNWTDATGISAQDEATVQLSAHPVLWLEKSASFSIDSGEGFASFVDEGDIVIFTVTVENKGNRVLQDVIVDDPSQTTALATMGSTCPGFQSTMPGEILLPGQTMSCSWPWQLTQADVDSGSWENVARVNGVTVEDLSGCSTEGSMCTASISDSWSAYGKIGVIVSGSLNMGSEAISGHEVGLHYNISNQGPTTLELQTLSDTLLIDSLQTRTPKVLCDDGQGGTHALMGSILTPGSYLMCYSSSIDYPDSWGYQLTLDDLDIGLTSTIATVTASTTTPVPVVVQATDTISLSLNSRTAIELNVYGSRKAINQNLYAYTNEEIEPYFSITNTGGTRLHSILVSETLRGGTINCQWPVCNTSTTSTGLCLEPESTMVCQNVLSYSVTENDIASGNVSSDVTATGFSALGISALDTASYTVHLPQQPDVMLAKSGVLQDVGIIGEATPGEKIIYSFSIANTGYTPLKGLSLQDVMSDPGNGCEVGSVSCDLDGRPVSVTGGFLMMFDGELAVGSTINCMSEYVISSKDIHAFQVTSNGKVCNIDVLCPASTENQDICTICSEAGTSTRLDSTGAISLQMTAETESPLGLRWAGDTVIYKITGANTGTMDLHSINLNDPDLNTNTPNTYDTSATEILCVKSDQSSISGTVPTSMFTNSHPLASGESFTCTLSYVLLQSDIDTILSNQVRNDAGITASYDTRDGGINTAIADAFATYQISIVPSISLAMNSEKPQTGSLYDSAKDTIEYFFRISNTGNTKLLDFEINDAIVQDFSGTMCTMGNTGASTSLLSSAILLPSEEMLCSATYSLMQGDIDACARENTATASAVSSHGSYPISERASNSVSLSGNTKLVLISNASTYDFSTPAGAGDAVPLEIVLQNEGSASSHTFVAGNVNNVDIQFSCVPAINSTLEPTGIMTCNGIYYLSQDDVELGNVRFNVASISGSCGQSVEEELLFDFILLRNPSVDITKVAVAGPGLDGIWNAGDTIEYNVTIANVGNINLHSLTFTDKDIDHFSCDIPSLLLGESYLCGPVSYELTQSDIDAGFRSNTACVSDGNANLEESCDTAIVTIPQLSSITLTKTATAGVKAYPTEELPYANDEVIWNIRIANTGATTLGIASITDALVDNEFHCMGYLNNQIPDTVLSGTSIDCTSSYKLVQSDVSSGYVENTACVSATNPVGEKLDYCDSERWVIVNTAELSFKKEPQMTSDVPKAGDVVAYTFSIMNYGNVEVENIAVSDPLLGSTAMSGCSWPLLGPMNSVTCGPIDHVLTQEDIDAGELTNKACVDGTVAESLEQLETICQEVTSNWNSILAVNLEQKGELSSDGSIVNYEFYVTNIGTVTLKNVYILDSLMDSTAITCPDVDLSPSNSMICTATWIVNQANRNEGLITNTACAGGHGPLQGQELIPPSPQNAGVEARDGCDYMEISIPQAASLDISNLGRFEDLTSDQYAGVGDRVCYKVVVSNNGNIDLTNVVIGNAFLDPVMTCPGSSVNVQMCCSMQEKDDTGLHNPNFILKIGSSITCSGCYYLNQKDVDAGNTITTANVSAVPTVVIGKVNSSTTDTVEFNGLSKISATKLGTFNGNHLGAEVKDTMSYSFVITNSGTTTLSNIEIVDDMLVTSQISTECDMQGDSISLGERVECSASAAYEISAEDIKRGILSNSAIVSGFDPMESKVSTVITHEQGLSSNPVIHQTLEMTWIDERIIGLTEANENIALVYTIKNNGLVALYNLSLDDSMVTEGPVNLECTNVYATGDSSNEDVANLEYVLHSIADVERLEEMQSVTCRRMFPVTQAMINNAFYEGSSNACGMNDVGEMACSKASAEVVLVQGPSINLTMTAEEDQDIVDALGGHIRRGVPINYAFQIVNTGNVPLSGVKIVGDDELAVLACSGLSIPRGENHICEGNYYLTQDDVNSGFVTKFATAEGLSPLNLKVSSSDSATVEELNTFPVIDVEISGVFHDDHDIYGTAEEGENITWTLSVTNVGQVTMNRVRIINLLVVPDTLHDGYLLNGCEMDGMSIPVYNQNTEMRPESTMICTYISDITQDDMNKWKAINNVTVQARAVVHGTSTEPVVAECAVYLPVRSDATLSLDGTVESLVGTTIDFPLAGKAIINYIVNLNNTGEVEMFEPRITDRLIQWDVDNGSIHCMETMTPHNEQGSSTTSDKTLQINEVLVCTAYKTVTQDMIDIGIHESSVELTWTTYENTTGVSHEEQRHYLQRNHTATITQDPSIRITKSGVFQDELIRNQVPNYQETVIFSISIENTGNTRLLNTSLYDEMLSSVICTKEQGNSSSNSALATFPTLVPGEMVVCTGNYMIEAGGQDSSMLGKITNTANVSAHVPGKVGNVVVDEVTAEVCLTESCTPPFAILGFNIDLFKYDWYTNNDSTSIQRHLQMGSLLGTTCEVADLVQACNEAFGVGNCMCVSSSTGGCGVQTGDERSSSTKIRELYDLQGSEGGSRSSTQSTTYRMRVTNQGFENNTDHVTPVLRKQEQQQQISRRILSEEKESFRMEIIFNQTSDSSAAMNAAMAIRHLTECRDNTLGHFLMGCFDSVHMSTLNMSYMGSNYITNRESSMVMFPIDTVDALKISGQPGGPNTMRTKTNWLWFVLFCVIVLVCVSFFWILGISTILSAKKVVRNDAEIDDNRENTGHNGTVHYEFRNELASPSNSTDIRKKPSSKDYMHPDVVHMYQNDNDDLHNDPNQQVNVNPMQESEEEWRHINFSDMDFDPLKKIDAEDRNNNWPLSPSFPRIEAIYGDRHDSD